MNQIALPFDASPLPPTAAAATLDAHGPDAVGFEIGWDHAHHRLTPPCDHLHGLHPVRQGWAAGRAVFGDRCLRPTRAVELWLALRLQAWLEGQPYEDVMLTPRYLAQIDTAVCPVTRAALGGRAAGGSALAPATATAAPAAVGAEEAVPMRLNLAAGWAAGNVVMVSPQVLKARGSADAATAEAFARQAAAASPCEPCAGDPAAAHGLDAASWARLASLLRLAEPLPHAQVACLPLRVMPPNRLRLLNPSQALQALLTQLFTDGEAYARRMLAIGALMPDGDTRRCYMLFMNAMLARRVGAGWGIARVPLRQALEDAWCHPVVQRRWEHLALRLSRAQCARIVRLATQRGLAGSTWRWLDDGAATEGWALPPRTPLSPAGARARAEAAAAAGESGAGPDAGAGVGVGADGQRLSARDSRARMAARPLALAA